MLVDEYCTRIRIDSRLLCGWPPARENSHRRCLSTVVLRNSRKKTHEIALRRPDAARQSERVLSQRKATTTVTVHCMQAKSRVYKESS